MHGAVGDRLHAAEAELPDLAAVPAHLGDDVAEVPRPLGEQRDQGGHRPVAGHEFGERLSPEQLVDLHFTVAHDQEPADRTPHAGRLLEQIDDDRRVYLGGT